MVTFQGKALIIMQARCVAFKRHGWCSVMSGVRRSDLMREQERTGRVSAREGAAAAADGAGAAAAKSAAA